MTLMANTRSMNYMGKMSVRGWQLGDWLPQSGLHHFTAQASVKGRGTDFLSDRSSLEAQLCIDSIGFSDFWTDDGPHGV